MPLPAAGFHLCGPLAQLAEQQTLNLRVHGSIPWRLTTRLTLSSLSRADGSLWRAIPRSNALSERSESKAQRPVGGETPLVESIVWLITPEW